MEYDEFNVYKKAFKDTIPSEELDKKIMDSINKDFNNIDLDKFESVESVIEFPKNRRKWIYVAAAILVVFAFSALGIMVGIKGKLNKIEREDLTTASDDKPKTNKKGILDNKYTTIALYGVDCREDGDSGRSDSIIVINLDNQTKKIAVVSLSRDLLVNYDEDYTSLVRLNNTGTFNSVTKALNTNLDMSIDKYIEFNFNSLIYLADLVDGIEINVTNNALLKSINKYGKEIADINSDKYIKATSTGLQTLNGYQLLGYVRTRKIDNENARMERIREVIQKMFSKIVTTNKIDLFTKNGDKLDTVLGMLKTNLGDDEIISLCANIKDYSIEDNFSFPINSADAPYKRISSDGSTYNMNCVISTDAKNDIIKLHNKLYPDEEYKMSDFTSNVCKYIDSVKKEIQ